MRLSVKLILAEYNSRYKQLRVSLCSVTWTSKAFQGKANSFVHHTQEVPDGEHHVRQAAIFDVDHQFMDLVQILILAIGHLSGSGRLKTTPPRPVVSSATAEEHNQ